jgi:uncharacterized protein (TIGR03083 family)
VDVTSAMATDNESPPDSLRGAVIDRAVRARTPGRPVGVEAVSPIDAYRDTTDDLRRLLADLSPSDWSAPIAAYAEFGWSAADLVGHLLAVERYFAARLGVGEFTPPEGTDTDHIAMSLPTIAASREQSPQTTVTDWSDAAEAALTVLDADEPVDLDRRVPFHGLDFRLGSLLVARAFELWIHGDDIRAATGRALTVPDASRLTLMTDLAVRALGRVLAVRSAASGSARPLVRLVLTGAGGGAWSIGGDDAREPDRPGDRPPPAARIVTDAEGFCRLAAKRTPPDAIDVDVSGDRALADRVLAAAAVLAA